MTKILLSVNALIAAAVQDELFALCSILVWLIIGIASLITGLDSPKT